MLTISTCFGQQSKLDFSSQIGEYVREVFEDKKGRLWFGTLSNGVGQLDGTKLTYFSTKQGLAGNQINGIAEDAEGNLWFGTDGVGVCKFDGMDFSHLTQEDGLCNYNVRQILEDKKGKLWFASWGTDDQNGGLSLFDGDSFKKIFSDIAGLSSANVSPIFEDKAGNIWIASMNFGVYRYDGKKLALFDETDRKDMTVNLCVQSILEDSKGTMWFGFSGGLFRLDGRSFANVTKDGPWK